MADLIVGVDLHGLIIEHRYSKYEYFRDVLKMPFSVPLMDREKILKEISKYGVGAEVYNGFCKKFYESRYAKKNHIIKGFVKFFNIIPKSWKIMIVTGLHASIEVILKETTQFRECHLIRCKDSDRVYKLLESGVQVYIDDKPNLLSEIRQKGILTIQISEPGYARYSPYANLRFCSWEDAIDNFHTIDKLTCAIRNN